VQGVEVTLRRVPETLSRDVLDKVGAIEPMKKFSHIPLSTLQELGELDAVIFGTPTRFGNMCGQMRQFLDASGGILRAGALVGKAGSVFYKFRNPARRTGVHNPQRPYNPVPPQDGHCRAPV